jgi:hypothetical protein
MADHKVHITLRLRERGLAWIDHLAAENRVTRSEVVRAALQVARVHEKEVKERLS